MKNVSHVNVKEIGGSLHILGSLFLNIGSNQCKLVVGHMSQVLPDDWQFQVDGIVGNDFFHHFGATINNPVKQI